MRVLVCGGRGFTDKELLVGILNRLDPDEIIVGGARGADKFAEAWGRHNQRKVMLFRADWGRWHNAAGPIRNQQMLAAGPDLVVAFRGGPGTQDMVDRAEKAGVEVRRILW